MSLDGNRRDLVLGVVGAGTMGRGIAQVAATGGIRVLLLDAREGAAVDAKGFIEKMVMRAVEKGTIARDDAEAAVGRIEVVDDLAAFAPCHVVAEAVVEDLAAKRKVFAELEAIVGGDCILATNTSSLSVTTIAAEAKLPERLAGMHFFNPVPLMKLVEVIDGEVTAPWVGEALTVVGKRMGREPVQVRDAPGFLVNQVGRGFTIEAAHLASEGIADFTDVDRIMREAAGFRMGPFELMDLTALDVTHPATEYIYEQSYHEPRFRPAMLMRGRMEGGRLGRKTEQGFYPYHDKKAVVPPETPAPAARPESVWVCPVEPTGHSALTALLKRLDAPLDAGERPGDGALCLVTPLGEDATTAALENELDPTRTVAVDTLFGLDRRRTCMTTPVTDPAFRDAARGLLASDGVPVTAIGDSPGFVAQRILAMIVNIGCSIAQSRTATPEDIDKAVKLGLGYPHGPLEFGDVLGPDRVLKVLTAMHRIYGDPRYRPSLWLSRRARIGIPLVTRDTR